VQSVGHNLPDIYCAIHKCKMNSLHPAKHTSHWNTTVSLRQISRIYYWFIYGRFFNYIGYVASNCRMICEWWIVKWRWLSSGLLRRVVWWKSTDVSEVLAAFIIRAMRNRPNDEGSKYLWNVGKLLPDYTAQQPRRQTSSYSPPWEPEISLNC
jgi:hypothetical protein